MRRILITGMSGTGKSSVLRELGARGYRTVDTDEPGWKERREDGEWVWRDDRMSTLLADDLAGGIVVAGCVANQGTFYDRFEAVVLLSAPASTLLRRLDRRTNNQFGKDPRERQAVMSDLATVEPKLRATCTHEVDASQPLAEVVAAVDAIAQGVDSQPRLR